MEKDWLNLSWKLLVARGVIGIIFGFMAMVWPDLTIIALVVLWGFWALMDGIGAFVQAFQPGAVGRWWLVAMGVIALAAAFLAIFRPSVTAVALTWILGIWLIVRGLFELVGAFASSRPTPRWLLVASGLLSMLIGFLFTANPGTGAIAVAVWIGLMALAWGVVFVGAGLMARRAARAHPLAQQAV
jgi:uncharacterized membrane protein HdeD (DUF308 family)